MSDSAITDHIECVVYPTHLTNISIHSQVWGFMFQRITLDTLARAARLRPVINTGRSHFRSLEGKWLANDLQKPVRAYGGGCYL